MERKQSMALFGIVVAAAITIVAIGLTNTPSVGLSADTINDKQHIMGHATLTVLDPTGNIIAYRQTDNAIMDRGDDCVATRLFTATGGNCATIGGQNTFRNIAIGTASSSTGSGLTLLQAEQTTGLTTARITASPTITTAATNGGGSTTTMTATFTTSAGMTIAEAGIFDTSTSSSGNMFARQTFANIQLLSGDSLGITWTVNVK